jgi:hypothetical protein
MRTAAARWVFLQLLLCCSAASAQEVTTSPQAAPIIAVLKAAKASDVVGFKNAYSIKIQEDTSLNWQHHMQQCHAEMQKKFGDYRLADFTYKFVGGSEMGDVTAYYMGNMALNLQVSREGDAWKVGKR